MVRRRIQISIALFLCFIAMGAQWDLLQTIAWGRMMAAYSRTMPLAQAVEKTFSGAMCGICRMVANARSQEPSPAAVPETKIAGKALLFFQAVPQVIVEAPRAVGQLASSSPAITEIRSAPPVPPPRAGST